MLATSSYAFNLKFQLFFKTEIFVKIRSISIRKSISIFLCHIFIIKKKLI